MIWIRLVIFLLIALLSIYYVMLIFQCMTTWFKFTNRKITFGRSLVPFYYWITSYDEPKKKNYKFSDYADEHEDEDEENEN